MPPSLTLATAVRVGAMAFAVAAIAAAAVHFREGDRRPPARTASPPPEADNDPLRAEIKRCHLLGEAGAHDDVCLRAWAENRRRYLGLAAASPAPPSTEIFAKPPSPANTSPHGAPPAPPTAKDE